jgi:hypothetical protein
MAFCWTPSILHAPIFWIHVHQAIPYKDIWILEGKGPVYTVSLLLGSIMKVGATSIVIVFLLVCRSIREHVFLVVCHSRCVREKAFEDSAPGRCGVSSDRNECVFFRKVMWSNKFLSQLFLFSVFLFFWQTVRRRRALVACFSSSCSSE